jgi:hypothetical protein
MLLLRVLGLVEVVPRLCCLPCPRRKLPGEVGDAGDGYAGDGIPEEPGEDVPAPERAVFSSIASNGDAVSSIGVTGLDRYSLASSGSTKSGGNRSFSISDLRLEVNQTMATFKDMREMHTLLHNRR